MSDPHSRLTPLGHELVLAFRSSLLAANLAAASINRAAVNRLDAAPTHIPGASDAAEDTPKAGAK